MEYLNLYGISIESEKHTWIYLNIYGISIESSDKLLKNIERV